MRHLFRVVAACLVCAALPRASRATDPPVAYMNLHSALAGMKATLAAGGQFDVMIPGDSITWRGEYITDLTTRLQNHFGDAGKGYTPLAGWKTGFTYGTNSLYSGWGLPPLSNDVAPYQGLDFMWSDYTPHDTPFDIAYYISAPVTTDQNAQLQFLKRPGGGSFMVMQGHNGAVIGTVSTSAATESVGTYNFTLPAGGAYTIRPLDDGPIRMFGEFTTKNTPGIRVSGAANGGWKWANFVHRDATFDQQVSLIHPNLVMPFLGANDASNTPAAQLKSNANTVVSRILADAPGASALLIVPFDLDPEPGYDDAIGINVMTPEQQIAAEHGYGLINLHQIAYDYPTLQSKGYLIDTVHPSLAGGHYLGRLLFATIMLEGKNIDLPGDTNADGIVNVADLYAVALHWQEQDDIVDYMSGDLNYDGAVNIDDLRILAGNWGATGTTSLSEALTMFGLPNVPEPASASIFAAAMIALSARGRHRRRY